IAIVDPVRTRVVEFRRSGAGDSRDPSSGQCTPDCPEVATSFPWTIKINGEAAHSFNANRISLLMPKPGEIEHWTYINGGARAQRQIPLQPLLALTTPDGKRLAAADIEGRPLAVAFGFTHCPDVCPTTLMDWSNVLASLGPDGDRLKVLFISVDPAGDAPAAIESHLH